CRRIDFQRQLLAIEFGQPGGPGNRAHAVVLAFDLPLDALLEAQLELGAFLAEAVAYPGNGRNAVPVGYPILDIAVARQRMNPGHVASLQIWLPISETVPALRRFPFSSDVVPFGDRIETRHLVRAEIASRPGQVADDLGSARRQGRTRRKG